MTFYILKETEPCNFADDTTPYACGLDLQSVLRRLENDTSSAIIWFEDIYMKLNEDKCHLLISGHTHEHLWAKLANSRIWESSSEKLLGVLIDKNLKFNEHVSKLCTKVRRKVTMFGDNVNFYGMVYAASNNNVTIDDPFGC